MRFSSDFIQLSRRKGSNESQHEMYARIAPPSLQRPQTSESEEQFEKRRSEFSDLFRQRAATLTKLADLTALIPALEGPVVTEYGVTEIRQTLNNHSEPDTLSAVGIHIIARDLADGLAKAHEQDECHLGITPSSISYSHGEVRLCAIGADLRGIAVEGDTFTDLGDIEYSPPELFDKSMQSQVGPWTDVYQASASLYALAVQEAPPHFLRRMDDPKGTLDLISSSLAEIEELESSGLAAAIISGLRLSRHMRPRNASEWLTQVDFSHLPGPVELATGKMAATASAGTEEEGISDAAQAEAEIEVVVEEETTSDVAMTEGARDELEEDRPTKRGLLPLLAVALLVAGGGVVYLANQPEQPDDPDQPATESAVLSTDGASQEMIASEEGKVEEISPIAWLKGEWVIDRSKNGCSQRLIIAQGDNENELLFTDPGANVSDKDQFTITGTETLKTSAWAYTRNGDVVEMVNVADASQTLQLSRC